MQRAIALARKSLDEGNGPAGCLIVKDGQILGEGRNLAKTSHDPTAHAEMAAIRDVAARLGENALVGSTLYASMEPCPMCCWAMLSTRISTLVLGARCSQFMTKNLGSYSVEALAVMTGRNLEVVTGVCQKECADLRYDGLERMLGGNRAKDQLTQCAQGEGVLRSTRKVIGAVSAFLGLRRKS